MDLAIRDGDRDIVENTDPGERFDDAFDGDGHQRGRPGARRLPDRPAA